MTAAGRQLRAEQGFSLIEVLVVMLVIGILAAIAIPAFLGQEKKADDSHAKSDVNRVAKMVEECKLDESSYAACDEQSELDGAPGITWGTTPGTAGVIDATDDSFYAYAVSRAETNGENHVFAWSKESDGVTKRVCRDSALGALSSGGCRDSKW